MCTSFNKGILYVRIQDGRVADFFYPDEEVPFVYTSFHCRNLATIHGEAGEASSGGWIEKMRNGENTGSGMLVEFRKATDDDIKKLLDVWKSRISIAQWVEGVQDYSPDLSKEEKDRIVRIAKPYIK